jgi:hypothetical protein
MVETCDHGPGFFIQWVQLPVAVIWAAMGEENGATSLEESEQGRALSARRAWVPP